MNKKLTTGLVLCVVFQCLILVGMYVKAAMPLWAGVEIKMKTLPVDPRSMFRGNYARLNYDISRIEIEQVTARDDLRNGEIVYVTLKPDANGLHEYLSVSVDEPTQGTFIRGRIKNRRYDNDVQYFRINYGIEAYFAPKEKALALESDLRDGAVAVLMLSSSGVARLKAIVEPQ